MSGRGSRFQAADIFIQVLHNASLAFLDELANLASSNSVRAALRDGAVAASSAAAIEPLVVLFTVGKSVLVVAVWGVETVFASLMAVRKICRGAPDDDLDISSAFSSRSSGRFTPQLLTVSVIPRMLLSLSQLTTPWKFSGYASRCGLVEDGVGATMSGGFSPAEITILRQSGGSTP